MKKSSNDKSTKAMPWNRLHLVFRVACIAHAEAPTAVALKTSEVVSEWAYCLVCALP